MTSVELPQPILTWEFVLQVIALILAAATAVITITKAMEAIRKVSVRKKVSDLEDRMDKVENRLKLGDRRFTEQSDDLGQVLVTMQAMMMHMISGNDREKLRSTEKELTDYIAKRHVRMSANMAGYESQGQ